MDKVAREVAEADFERFCEMLAAYSKASRLTNEDDIKSYEDQKDTFVAAVMSGSLVVEADGSAVYTPYDGGEPLRFGEPRAAALIAVDRYKKDQTMQRQLAMFASFTGRPESEIGKLLMRDVRVCTALTNGFF